MASMIVQSDGKYGMVIREEHGCYFVSFADGTHRYVRKEEATEIEFVPELTRLTNIVTNRIGTPEKDMTDMQMKILSMLQQVTIA
jgi:hypothetical protein